MRFSGCIDRLRDIISDYEDDKLEEITVTRATLDELWARADTELSNVFWAGEEEKESRLPNNTRIVALELFDTLWQQEPAKHPDSARNIMDLSIELALKLRDRIPHEPDEL